MSKKLCILGIRGVPAAHGGFETFAARLAPYMVQKGWDVTVYCQHEGNSETYEDDWNGVTRVNIFVANDSAANTLVFDWKSILHASKNKDTLALTLGYNSAILSAYLPLRGIKNVINMDGIEWKRSKWSPLVRVWFWLNEHIGSRSGTHLVADHPEIKSHLVRSVKDDKVTVIPYGGDDLDISTSDINLISHLDIESKQYCVIIARPEPENSLLEIVQSFSTKPRGIKLVILGSLEESNEYHKRVLDAASDEVTFPGAIYDINIVTALRAHALFYLHGHTVGGTNPSLVEAMGAKNAVIAHDNKFNRWVVGDGAVYFNDQTSCEQAIEQLINSPEVVKELQHSCTERFNAEFTWDHILGQYESLLDEQYVAVASSSS